MQLRQWMGIEMKLLNVKATTSETVPPGWTNFICNTQPRGCITILLAGARPSARIIYILNFAFNPLINFCFQNNKGQTSVF